MSADPAANSSPESIAPDLKSLHLEVNRILLSDGILVHGPDNFEGFSLSSLLAELRQLAPGLVELCISLGDTHRNADCDDIGDEDALIDNDIKVLVYMCTLLNARSRQVNGLQLLLSLMLVARAINKQVSSYLKKISLDIDHFEFSLDHYFWIYNNLNIHHVVIHEREGTYDKYT